MTAVAYALRAEESHEVSDAIEVDAERLAGFLLAFDVMLASEVREHLIARLEQWRQTTSPQRARQMHSYASLVQALERARS